MKHNFFLFNRLLKCRQFDVGSIQWCLWMICKVLKRISNWLKTNCNCWRRPCKVRCRNCLVFVEFFLWNRCFANDCCYYGSNSWIGPTHCCPQHQNWQNATKIARDWRLDSILFSLNKLFFEKNLKVPCSMQFKLWMCIGLNSFRNRLVVSSVFIVFLFCILISIDVDLFRKNEQNSSKDCFIEKVKCDLVVLFVCFLNFHSFSRIH